MIGYYVHDHGSGHLTRARIVADRLGAEVTGLSSLPRPEGWVGPWLQLPHDAVPPPGPDADASAGGVLHFAPLGHEGYARRMAMLAEWAAATRPRLVVVDVSVEVAVFVRLLGVRVVVVAMRGDRTDRAHTTAYDLADRLVALWPAELASEGWPRRWVDKTAHVGGFSRIDNLARAAESQEPQPHSSGTRSVLLLWGRGGDGTGPDVAAAAAATEGSWSWHRPDATASPSQLWRDLCAADVVVTHAGQNAVAEVAASRRPAVVVAEQRPFGEQAETAAVLAHSGIAVGLPEWPGDEQWPAVLDRARRLGGRGWARWSDLHGADRLVEVLAEVGAS